MAKLKITKTDASGQIHDRYTGPEYINSAYVGGTGGNTTQTGRRIQPTVYIGSGPAASGSILRQKGAHKFLATDNAGNTAVCTLVNLSTPTAANTMSVAVTLYNITSANLVAANVVGGATSTYVTFATANVSGPVPVAVGQTLTGFGGNAAAATITAINATSNGGTLANVTVSLAGNTAALTTNVSDTVNASRITNRYVYDFGNDGNQIDGENGVSSTYYTSNYNPNKYRYHLSAADSTFVMVAYA